MLFLPAVTTAGLEGLMLQLEPLPSEPTPETLGACGQRFVSFLAMLATSLQNAAAGVLPALVGKRASVQTQVDVRRFGSAPFR